MATMTQLLEERDFLQQQVHRLNAVLSQYQKKYSPPGPEDEKAVPLSPQGPSAAWLTDKRFLAPLLTEYDNVISELRHHISTYQAEQETLTSRVEEVTAENARLYQELHDALEGQLHSEGGKKRGAGGGGGQREGGLVEGRTRSTAVGALQHQLAAITKDKDGYREKWKQMSYELEHLQRSEQEKGRALEKCKEELATALQVAVSFREKVEELQATCVKLDKERQVCLQTAQAGEQEVEQLSEALSQARSELKAAQLKNTELLKAQNDVTLQLKRMEAERQHWEGQGQSLDGNIHLLQLTNTELEAKLLAAQREVAVLSREKEELEERVTLQQTRLASLGQEVQDAVSHVKESMQMVESAILDKDQAVIQSQQQAQEIERLKKAMATLLQEAGQRTRREVDTVREGYNRNIDKMAEEIHKLEQECGEKQTMLERAQREKKMAERELERVTAQHALESSQAGESIQQLHSRVYEAERVGEEARRKMEGAFLAQKTAEASLVEQRKRSDELSEELRTREKELMSESQQLREEREQLARQCQELQQQMREVAQAREMGERRMAQELAAVAQHYELREKELMCRIQSSEEAHQRSTAELRELLTAQYRVGTRWKEESKTLSQKFEETIANLRGEVVRYRRRSEEQQAHMSKLNHTNEQLSKQLRELKSTKTSLIRHLRETEDRAEATAAQVTSLITREKELLQERRELQRQLDQLKLQISRRAGISLVASGLPVPLSSGSRGIPATPPGAPHTPFSKPLDPQSWSEALASLHQSIRQVRQELNMEDSQEMREGTPRPPDTRQQYSRSKAVVSPTSQECSSPEDDSEHSSLSRRDLSSHSHISTHSNTMTT